MARIYRDNHGNKIGSVVTQSGHRYAYDADGRRVGHYDENTDTTYDARGRRVGSGDQLVSLMQE